MAIMRLRHRRLQAMHLTHGALVLEFMRGRRSFWLTFCSKPRPMAGTSNSNTQKMPHAWHVDCQSLNASDACTVLE
jgi:hypothetical protein